MKKQKGVDETKKRDALHYLCSALQGQDKRRGQYPLTKKYPAGPVSC